MPNDCRNVIIVRGEPRELKRFDDQFKAPHKDYTESYGGCIKEGERFDISKISGKSMNDVHIKIQKISRPAPFLNTDNKPEEELFDIVVGIDEQEYTDYSFNNFIPVDPCSDNGACIREWGTKWDLYDLNEEVLKGELEYINSLIDKEDKSNAART